MTSLMERAQRTAPTAAQLAAQRAANAIAAASNQLSSSWNRAFSKDGYIISDGSALALTRAKLAFWILSMIIVLGCFVLSRWFFRWARKNEYSPWSYIAAASTTVIFLVLKIVHWHIGARNSLASAGLDAASVLILVTYLAFTILGLWILFNVSAGFSGKVGKIILVALLVILAIVQVGISIRYYVLYSSYRGTVNRINTSVETQRQNDMVRQLSYLSYAGNSLGLTYQLIAMLSGLGLMLYCDRQARTVWTYIVLLSYSIFFAVRAASSGISVAMYTLWRGNALYIATPGAYTYIQVSEFLGWFLWATTLALIAVAAAKAGDYEDYEEEEEPKQA